jgi:hypothetical protein
MRDPEELDRPQRRAVAARAGAQQLRLYLGPELVGKRQDSDA